MTINDYYQFIQDLMRDNITLGEISFVIRVPEEVFDIYVVERYVNLFGNAVNSLLHRKDTTSLEVQWGIIRKMGEIVQDERYQGLIFSLDDAIHYAIKALYPALAVEAAEHKIGKYYPII